MHSAQLGLLYARLIACLSRAYLICSALEWPGGVVKGISIAAAAFLLSMSLAQAAAPAAAVPTTFITVNGDGGGRVYDGVGAILGGGGNARYLEDYPAAQRASILDYLFKPGYGASLQASEAGNRR